MKEYKLNYTQEINVTDEDIDAIVCMALEGGITYWCNEVKVVGDYLGEFASDQISRDGKLIIVLDEPIDEDDCMEYTLTKERLLKGLKMYLSDPERPYDITMNLHGILSIDPCNIDATVADMIIQYALFEEIVFG